MNMEFGMVLNEKWIIVFVSESYPWHLVGLFISFSWFLLFASDWRVKQTSILDTK